MKPPAPKLLRCAVYTRVSTEHGLEQSFNSLDSQREAAQAYVKSQAHEGWRAMRERYDDGGFSGGTMDRPALVRLLDDIAARRVDIVVVYKVDRLTRSLADFAKLVELFDANAVSFVSVTQSFNTTTSMGRLTLNVLLSFAQFEREVTGERIRDKIAASKRKGIWVGGVVPFGYGLHERKLLVDAGEAATVRLIFERYIALGSLSALQRELRERGVVTRRRTLRTGTVRGGVALTNGPLAHMLRNRVYRGELNHHGRSYPAEHLAIVDAELFAAVGAKLDANRGAHRRARQPSDALLAGMLFDDRGHRMSPSYAVKKGLRYRYYVSTALLQGRKDEAGSLSRVAADAVEAAVADALAGAGQGLQRPVDRDGIAAYVDRITVGGGRLLIELRAAEGLGGTPEPLDVAFAPEPFRRRREVIAAAGDGASARPMRDAARGRLLLGIARARRWLGEIMGSAGADLDTIAAREDVDVRTARTMLSLAFVAPDIVEAAVAGTLPRGFGLSRLTDLPASWAEQRRQLGIGR